MFGNEYKLISILKHIDAEIGFSILPSQIGSSSERSLMLSLERICKQRRTWFIILHPSPSAQTNLLIHTDTTTGRSGCFLPLPYRLSPDVSYF